MMDYVFFSPKSDQPHALKVLTRLWTIWLVGCPRPLQMESTAKCHPLTRDRSYGVLLEARYLPWAMP